MLQYKPIRSDLSKTPNYSNFVFVYDLSVLLFLSLRTRVCFLVLTTHRKRERCIKSLRKINQIFTNTFFVSIEFLILLEYSKIILIKITPIKEIWQCFNVKYPQDNAFVKLIC